MSSVLTVEQREQAGSDSYNRFEFCSKVIFPSRIRSTIFADV